MNKPYPRLMIAGTSGDAGKTVVSLGLLSALKNRNFKVAAFKKGPDYIDTAWMTRIAGNPARNLDTFLSGFDTVRDLFCRHGIEGVNIIEGNRGLYDGSDPEGTHSAAELAKLLNAPVLLIHDVTKVTRTVAAMLTGCALFDRDVKIAGFILNRVAGPRHENIIKESLKKVTDIPVVGSIRKLPEDALLPERHLGLITPDEFEKVHSVEKTVREIAETYLDVDRIIAIADAADPLPFSCDRTETAYSQQEKLKVCYFRDSAFNFYYPDNLEALEQAGIKLIPVSSMDDAALPECDGLYIGGGFPETHAELITRNSQMRESVKTAVENGLPVYAECGGLLYLCKSLSWKENVFPMAGVFQADMRMEEKPKGHGYCDAEVDRSNPVFPAGTRFKGHEFHYSHAVAGFEEIETSFRLHRGVGFAKKRCGIVYKNVFATFVHIHSSGVKEWAEGFKTCMIGHKKAIKKM